MNAAGGDAKEDRYRAFTPHARALALLEMKRPADARREVVDRLAERPDDAYLHYLLGYVLLELADLAGAIDAANSSNGLDPGRGYGHALLARAYHAQGKLDAAIRAATDAIAVNPRDAASFAIRGTCLWNKGSKTRGRADLEESRRIDPNYMYPRLVLYDQLTATWIGSDARAALGEMAAIDPENADVQVRLAHAARWEGDYATSLERFDAALRFDPSRTDLVEVRDDAVRFLHARWLRLLRWMALSTFTLAPSWLAVAVLFGGLASATVQHFRDDKPINAIAAYIIVAAACGALTLGTFGSALRGLADAWIVWVKRRPEALSPLTRLQGERSPIYLLVATIGCAAGTWTPFAVAGAMSALTSFGLFATFYGSDQVGARIGRFATSLFATTQPGFAFMAIYLARRSFEFEAVEPAAGYALAWNLAALLITGAAFGVRFEFPARAN